MTETEPAEIIIQSKVNRKFFGVLNNKTFKYITNFAL